MAHHRLAAQARCAATSIEPEAVRVRLLGGFGVSVGSRTVEGDGWRLKKARSLIKLLALTPDHRLHRDQALDLLWPSLDPRSAANNLHRVLHCARRMLEPSPNGAACRYLPLRNNLLLLCPEGPLWVDVEAFESAAATARHTREPAAYRAAIDLYSGDLLPEDRYEVWAEERRREIRTAYLALLIELAALHEERGDIEPAIEALGKVVAGEPAHEEARVGLIRLLALSGKSRRAIAQYERLREALAKLGAEPEAASRSLHEEVSVGRFRLMGPPEIPWNIAGGHNLPNPHSSFVGREDEILEVKRLLSMTQLLTLTGPGGCGKTRLALELARQLTGAYPDGVWMVRLAPLSNPALVPQAVAATLEVREQPDRPLIQTLSNHLVNKRMLMVLDNCEHLIDATARLVDTLLGSCLKLRILATSREALGVAGESKWPVSPLTVPEAWAPVEDLIRYESVRLLLERANSKLPTFDLTPRNAPAVAEVCRKLDGIPLAIELAAARVSALAIEQVAERLADSLKLLTNDSRTADPRHQTMRATLDWSYELLSEPEKGLFCRLSVFAGGCTLEAAEEACSGAGIEQNDVLNLLSRLVNKSLVMAEAIGDGAPRYRLLEPVRQYAREMLEESGETKRVQERHAEYYLAFVERVEPELSGTRPVPWLELLDTEYGDLRTALSWALDTDEESAARAEMGLRLAAALGRFWEAHGPGEGRRWLEKGLAKSGASPASVRAKALNQAGFIAVYEGDPEALPMLEESLALYKELKDLPGAALAISNLGHAMVHVGRRERMVSLREEAEAMMSETSEQRVRAHLLTFLGLAAASEMDFQQMEARLEEALALFRELEDVRSVAVCLLSLGYVSIGRNDPRGAARFEESLLLQRELKNKTAIVMGVLGMAGVAALQGQPTRSAKLMGASEALREEIGLTSEFLSKGHYDYEKYLATVRGALGEAAFEAALSEGRAMSPEQAIEYVLSAEDTSPPVAPEPRTATTDPLTHRQWELALLIGRGLANRQIAEELQITGRTVETHVSKILRKLGLHSRTQIATWVIQQGPGSGVESRES